jgi:hypothetical protein
VTFGRREVLQGLGAAALVSAAGGARAARPVDWEDVASRLGDADERAWLTRQVPLFDCPDPSFLDIYYFRWRSYFHSLKRSRDGWVVWEFPYHVTWAGLHNTIVDAAAHHIHEGRWLRDPTPMRDYLRFWLTNGDAPLRGFSCWIASAALAFDLVHPEEQLAARLLQPLVHNYHAWEDVFRRPDGLYTQLAVNDGMEEAASGPQGLRPTLNSYQYGDARAIATIARGQRLDSLAAAYQRRAATLKALVQARLWNPETRFFDTIRHEDGRLSGERELVGYIPWYFDLPDARFAAAWAQLTDPAGFAAPYGPTTLERRSPKFTLTESDSLWNGSSWPYATSQTLVAMANLLNRGEPAPVGRNDYFDLLSTYVRSQYRVVDGERVPWIGESLQPLNGHWTSETRGYNHSTFADLVITGLVGLRPGDDERLVVRPLLPADRWDFCALRHIAYRGHDVSISWDRTGRRYGRPGLELVVDGRTVASRPTLGPLSAPLPPRPTAIVVRQVRDEIGPGPVDRVTATASFWKADPPSAVLDAYDADGLWDFYSSGLDTDWLQLTFPSPVRLAAITWWGYEDEARHKAPAAAAIEIWDGQEWRPARHPKAEPAIPTTGRNRISFVPEQTNRVRLLLTSRKPGRHGIGGAVVRVAWETAAGQERQPLRRRDT